MKRVASFVLIVIFLLTPLPVAAAEPALPLENANEVILRLLFHPIDDEVINYYGEPRQLMNDKVLDIQKVPGTPFYEVTVQVETFVGPHNPPYGLDTLTFYISYGNVELRKFQHLDV